MYKRNVFKFILFALAVLIVAYIVYFIANAVNSNFSFMDNEEIYCETYLNSYTCEAYHPELGWDSGTEKIILFSTPRLNLFMYQIDGYKAVNMENFSGYDYFQFDKAFINPMRKIEYGDYDLSIESAVKNITASDLIVGVDPNSLIYEKKKNENFSFVDLKSKGFVVSDASQTTNNDIIFRLKEAKRFQVTFVAHEQCFRIYLLIPTEDNYQLDSLQLKNMIKY